MSNKTFIVSGAGSGIGRAIALTLAESSTVILVGRDKTKLRDTQKLLPNSESHSIVSADLRRAADLREGFKALQLENRNLIGVVANAGIGGENKYGDGDRWQEVLDTNLTGTYNLVNEALPALRKGREEFKHVVVISSILARLGVPGYSAYCASKAALLGLTRSWASEWAREKILVNAICPGWVETEMAVSGLRQMADGSGKPLEKIRDEQMRYVPLGKMSEPREIAALVGFLVGGKQTSFTGQALDINNGALMP